MSDTGDVQTANHVVIISTGGWRGSIEEKNFRPLIQAHRDEDILLDTYHFLYCYFLVNFWKSVFACDTIVFGAGPLHPLLFPVWVLRLTGKNIIYYTSWPYWEDDRWAYSTVLDWLFVRVWTDFLQRSHTVAVTNTAAEAVKRIGGSATVVPHAVDTDTYSPSRVDTDTRTMLYAGRLEARKGVPEIIELAERLPEDVSVRVAGRGELAEATREHDDIDHLGYLSAGELADEYSRAGVFVAPSRPVEGWTELFGIVLIESMASGTPVVTTDCPGPQEIVTTATGRVVSNDSDERVEQLEHHVREILSDPNQLEWMETAARERAISQYSETVTAQQWIELLSAEDRTS